MTKSPRYKFTRPKSPHNPKAHFYTAAGKFCTMLLRADFVKAVLDATPFSHVLSNMVEYDDDDNGDCENDNINLKDNVHSIGF